MIKKKEIIINNEKDLDRFYKKLWLYKLIFFMNTNFKSDSENIRHIITALNIKNRRKRITYIYDYACMEVDNYWKDKNPCCFKNNKCLTQQNPNCIHKNGCCRKCFYQSSAGCTTANLTCKFFYCTEVSKKYKVITMNDLKILKLLSFRQRIILKHAYFSSREEVLKDLSIGSVFIFSIRIVFRYITKNIV